METHSHEKTFLLGISVRRWQNIIQNRNQSHKRPVPENPLVLALSAFHHSSRLETVLEIFVQFLVHLLDLSLVLQCL